MLQLFNVSWADLAEKMPEIAEAGYTSLWLPPPAKAGSVFSVGYDLFDPFDLGNQNQRGTIPTKYGTKAELLHAVQMAHRFGIRVYFDNIMNHRGFDVPGYNSSTPTNLYPGMVPGDFHLKTSGTYYQNWPNIGNWSSVTEIQNQPLFGLLDIANEPGSLNLNTGETLGSTRPKPVLIRQPGSNSYYMNASLPSIGGPWKPFSGASGTPVAEDVNAYLIRAALWMVQETHCDGFRFDAVKHVPSGFFGDTSDTFSGYTGAIQAMYDYVHGYGNNVTTNGYVESGGNRDSLFNTEAARNDALLFGEHLGEPPGFQEYLDRGMRLLNAPLHSHLNNVLDNPSAGLWGMDQRDFRAYNGAFTGPQSVLFAQSHDDGYAKRRELQNAYNFSREGLPSMYSDGYNQAQAGPGEEPFPRVASAPFLGQFGDNKMPDLVYLHHQLARGGTRSRWSDSDVVAFERYDYREVSNAYANPDATVVLFAMNDNYSSDISFDDGVSQQTAGTYYECFPVSSSRGLGLAVGFPPGSVLWQLADSPNGGSACSRILVRQATQNLAEAQASAADPNPVHRKVYVGGQTLAPGGGAIEFKIPRGSYVLYGYQWPEPSRAALSDAIELRQGGVQAPRLLVTRKDGKDGDAGFNPLYPFKMRGRIGPDGVVLRGTNSGVRSYNIDVPVVTNGLIDIVVRSDASAASTLVKLNGGVDLNSQMGLGPVSGSDRRDHRPGYATDLFLGYEQSALAYRHGPEKFAATAAARNNVTSRGAETYSYTVGGTDQVTPGAGNGAGIFTATAHFVEHAPDAANTAATPSNPSTQRLPLSPVGGQAAVIWVKTGYKLEINQGRLYYTTDGSSPEGAFGRSLGTAQVVPFSWSAADATDPSIDWWKATLPAQAAGTQVRYKIGFYHNNVAPISDADGAKRFGLFESVVTNFHPANARVFPHNNLRMDEAVTGLAEGYHILRARTFLPREGKSSVFNTFVQTFYYDAGPPQGVVAFPAQDGTLLNSSSYEIVIRADASATRAEIEITDAQGKVTGTAVPVSANPAVSQSFPELPKEFRYTYQPIPSSGAATIRVQLFEATSDLFGTTRVTTLQRQIQTGAPASSVSIVRPELEGSVQTLAAGEAFTIQTCFTATLATNDTSGFGIYVNGLLQPRDAYLLRAPGSVAGCGNEFRTLLYNWTSHEPGTNVIRVVFSGSGSYEDRTTLVIARPGDTDGDGMTDAAEFVAGTDPLDRGSVLKIVEVNGNQVIVWQSTPGIRYEVYATTDLSQPLQRISPVITATGTSTFYSDPSPKASQRFYRVGIAQGD